MRIPAPSARLLSASASAVVLITACVAAAQIPASALLDQLNRLRERPASFAEILRKRRPFYHGNLFETPGQTDVLTQEGVGPLDEAIAALQNAPAAPPVVLSAGLTLAAADHVFDAGPRGLVGHTGSDGVGFIKRIERHGTWSGEVGENISYGARDGSEVVVELVIDDGVPSRGHRKSLLDPRWRYVGIACGPHARYETICVIDFASRYQER